MSDAVDRFFGGATAAEFPRYLMYDVNNVCNARCPFCPQSAIAVSESFAPRHLAWEDFEKTIREAARYPVELVRFTGDGEPLLHPRMTDMIALAVDLGLAKVNLTTNGSLIRGKRLEELVRNPPHVLDLSLDAARPETYAKYRVGLDFDVTVANVHAFLARRDPKRTKVVLSMIHHPGLDDEVAEFRAYWEPLVDEVAIRGLHSNLGSVDVGAYATPDERWPCPHLWQRLVVDFRGHIRFCPIDWHDKSFVGQVADMTLHEAWHGPLLKGLRRRHVANDFAGCGVCEKCKDWSQTPWGHTWLDMMKKPALATHG
jgi:MoaA/NifB/PqqE/SkfB family radical SAM enzyme